MWSVDNSVVKPLGGRYKNVKRVSGKELVLNTEIFNHQYINREAVVISTPSAGSSSSVEVGDKVLVHHNVFRRWHNQKGKEKNSRSFLREGEYLIAEDQIYLRNPNKSTTDWACIKGY